MGRFTQISCRAQVFLTYGFSEGIRRSYGNEQNSKYAIKLTRSICLYVTSNVNVVIAIPIIK